MTAQELMKLADTHGFKLCGSHAGAGHFRDLFFDGKDGLFVYDQAKAFLDAARKGGLWGVVGSCDNPEHPDYRKPHIEFQSVWMEDPNGTTQATAEQPRLAEHLGGDHRGGG